MSNKKIDNTQFSRRDFLKLGVAGTAAVTLASSRLIKDINSISAAEAASFYIEAFPTSPLILSPFSDELPIPKALAPVQPSELATWSSKPGSGVGQQNSFSNEQHQIWPTDPKVGYGDPLIYQIKVQVSTHW